MKMENKKITKIKIGAVLSTVLIAGFLSGLNAFAYGPERPTFTDQNPADYVTFNSITNNPSMGDERNFVRIREAGVGNYVDKIDIVPGKSYEVWTYVHNNASETYNAKEHNYKGIALDVRMKATLPATISKGQTARVVSTISASNSKPLSVWDEATLTSSQRNVILNYVQGSAKVATSNGAIKGMGLNNNELFGNGSLLGYSALNGAIPGCTQYTLTVVYQFTATYPDFSVSKQVSKSGANAWVEDYKAKPGEKVDFKINYKNTGTVNQEKVVVQDMLPAGLKLVKGTTRISTPSDPAGKLLNDDIVAAGIGIRNYSVGGSATITFTAEVDSEKLTCGTNKITNIAKVVTQNGVKQDDATVTVQKDCTPKQVEEFCTVPGKGNLKKDDPNCVEKCTTPGKEHLNKNDPNCTDKCKVPGLEHLNANDKNCVEIPSELPQTGPAEAAAMIIAVVALTSGIAYYMRSRQELKNATAENGNIKAKITSAIDKIKSKISKK